MAKEFIPELHDIGKLIDKEKLKQENLQWSRHTFEDFDFNQAGFVKPTSPSWWGQYHHRIDVNKDLNDWTHIDGNHKPDLFLLILADHLASSISRALPQLGSAGESDSILKLWNHGYSENQRNKGKHWAAFKTKDDLKSMFELIDSITSYKDFLDAYRENLLLTPEDKSIPRNITSLFTHIKLVGKIYRVLKRHILIKNNGKRILFELSGEQVKSIRETEGGNRTTGNQNVDKGRWQARFVKCHIKFPHSFVRLQDINLLVKRNKLVSKLVDNYEDYVIFYNPDFLFLFLPMGIEIEDIFKELLNLKFFIDYVEIIADLGILRSNLDSKIIRARRDRDIQTLNVLQNRKSKVYKKILLPEFPEKIYPPICDICQRERATERAKENIREWLCDKCQSIRDMDEPFREYAEWTDEKVVWLKFNFNQDKLEKWLQEAFEEYIDKIPNLENGQVLKEEFRSLAPQMDFINDYEEMLLNFWQRCSEDDIKRPISNYNEIATFKYSGLLIMKIITLFIELHDAYFLDCKSNTDSPISLSLSIAHHKYPIREHWRYFENPINFLNIRYHNVFKENYTKEEAKEIIEKLITSEKVSSHFLHNLIALYEELDSELHIAIELLNNRKKYPEPFELYSRLGIPPVKFLNFCRIAEEEKDVLQT